MKFNIYRKYMWSGNLSGRYVWRWRLKGSNGRIIAASSQAFASKQAAKNNAKLTRDRLASLSTRAWQIS